MAKFLLQKDTDTLDIEHMIVKQLLDKNSIVHEYSEISLYGLRNVMKQSTINKDFIPVGTIEFVSEYIKYAYDIERENPIEVPSYLRTEEFLKREYNIVTWDKIPDKGRYFIKDVSQLKKFGMVLNLEWQLPKEVFDEPKNEFDTSLKLSKEHLYQVSSIFNIQSEYRVYVIDHKIQSISHYNGDPTILPDVKLIQKAINLIELNEKWLKSYTIDIMVGPKGTAIIEIHNFTSVGLYSSLWGTNLLYAYKDGIDYLINDNKPITI